MTQDTNRLDIIEKYLSAGPLGNYESIAIVAYNIYEGGGKIVLESLTKILIANNIRVHLIVNHSLRLTMRSSSKLQISTVMSSASGRVITEFRLKKIISNDEAVLMFGNFPPLRHLEKPTYLFIQNAFILESLATNYHYSESSLKSLSQKIWFHLFLKNISSIIVQTEDMKAKASKKNLFISKKIFVNNFFDSSDINSIITYPKKLKRESKRLVYLASDHKHKNHVFLARSLFIASKKISNLELIICLPEKSPVLDTYRTYARNNFKLTNIYGYSRSQILTEIYNSDLSVYPSLIESFGLPVLESILLGTPVIAANLSYLSDIRENITGWFNPFDEDSCSDSIVEFFLSR